MRVIQVTTLAGPEAHAGGVWQVARTQTVALRRAGHEVRLLAGWMGPDPPSAVDGTQAELFRARPVPGLGLRGMSSRALPSTFAQLVRDADIVHLHLCRDLVTTRALSAAVGSRVPVVAQCHGMLGPPRDLLQRLFDRAFLEDGLGHVQRYLALTGTEREQLVAMGIDGTRIEAIHNSVVPPGVRWKDPETPSFLFAGRLQRRKQPETFVRAATRVLRGGLDAQFTIAGPDHGSLRAVLRAVTESGFAEHFSVLGAVSHDKVLELLAGATAFVLPSRDEPYPMAALEATSIGVPMILTAESGISAGLAAADAAVVVPPEEHSIALAMEKVADSAALRKQLSSRSLAFHQGHWSLEALATRLLEVYEAVR